MNFFASLGNVVKVPRSQVKDGLSSADEFAAERLLRGVFVAALKKSDNSYLLRQRRMEYDLHSRDEFTEDYNIPDPRHFYDITIPNDGFTIHDGGHADHHEEEEHTEHASSMMRPSLIGDPHPVVENAHNFETNVNNLLASANSLKMKSVQLQSQASEMEKEAEMLHSKAGGPVTHIMETPVTEAHISKDEKEKHEKCCKDGEGPERGGSAARPIVNGQTLPGGVEKAPPPPALGPPTYEVESPVKQINIGYPMFNLPARTGDVTIPDYQKPLPPLIGNNPYEVLTSSSLNGTAYKVKPFGEYLHPSFTQKYVISLSGVNKVKNANKPKQQEEKTVSGESKTLKSTTKKKKKKKKYARNVAKAHINISKTRPSKIHRKKGRKTKFEKKERLTRRKRLQYTD